MVFAFRKSGIPGSILRNTGKKAGPPGVYSQCSSMMFFVEQNAILETARDGLAQDEKNREDNEERS
jgi:hypothetical protein